PHNPTDVRGIPWTWFRDEKRRLQTFAIYPSDTKKSAILLAEAGFVYIGSGRDSDDSVICFDCKIIKRNWLEFEDIKETHRTMSPTCGMVLGTAQNISFGRMQQATNLNAIASSVSDRNVSDGGSDPSRLGIITERPKRCEYAVRVKRLESFGEWPADHHINKEDLADAGYYYAGYGDCARCFYCGGGLRNWEQDDDVWVEHARWFPKCAFIRQRLGKVFIDTVAHLARTKDNISFMEVVTEMKIDPAVFQIDSKETPLKNDAAVLAVKEMGYREKDILSTAANLKESGQILSADVLFTALEEKGVQRLKGNMYLKENSFSISVNRNKAKDEELLGSLKQKNDVLRLQTLCKICMDKEVAIVFLPCGHLVCCTECAAAMKDCPVCRSQVKGVVRAFMG
ncbi:hypothetical protein EGW08_022609, partial [Elysia chlorotica]